MNGVIADRLKGENISMSYASFAFSTDKDTGKHTPVLFGAYTDLDSNTLHKFEIPNPTYLYYMVKPEVQIGPRDTATPISDCEAIEVPYVDVTKDIAERTGQKSLYNQLKSSGGKRATKQFHQSQRVRASDKSLVDNFMFRFNRDYQNSVYTPTKGYFDIEVDTRYYPGDLIPPSGSCPINAASFLNDKTKEMLVFILDPEPTNGVIPNPSVKEFTTELFNNPDAIYAEFDTILKDHLGDKNYEKVKDIKFKYSIHKDELSFLSYFMKAMNDSHLNFIMAWNIAFDFPFIYERIVNLGYNPEDIMCDQSFEHKCVSYRLDTFNVQPSAKSDVYTCSSYSAYVDQMIQYAGIRKSDTSVRVYKLENIATDIIGVGKLNWRNKYKTFDDFINNDFKLYVFYNMIDVIVQKLIEDVINDINYMIASSIRNCTALPSIFKQTVSLANRAMKEWFDIGYITNTNHNINNEKTSYPGAFVADGRLINDVSRMKTPVISQALRLFNNNMDYDYASLYPSITMQFNASASTQIGMVTIDEPPNTPVENKYNNPYYSRSGRFMDDLIIGDELSFGNIWCGLGTILELFDDISEFIMEATNINVNDIDVYRDRLFDIVETPTKDNMPSLFRQSKFENVYNPLFTVHHKIDDKFREKVNNIDMRKIFSWKYDYLDSDDTDDSSNE